MRQRRTVVWNIREKNEAGVAALLSDYRIVLAQTRHRIDRSVFWYFAKFCHRSAIMALTIKQTSMTLSERFRILRAQALSREQSSLIVGTVTENGSVRGSARNQKLANQLATRPAVQAALRLKNRSIKQRLGIKASGRLGPPVSSYDNYGYGTSINDVASTRLSVHSTYLNHTPFQPKARFSGWRRLGPRNFRPFYQR